MEQQQNVLSDLTLDAAVSEQIRSFAGWAKFLSIMGFILCGLMLLVGIFAGSFLASMGRVYSPSGSTGGAASMFTIIYIFIALIYFVPTLFLYQSSVKLRYALAAADQRELLEGFTKLKASFRFVGILTIILLSIYALIFLFAILATMMR